VFSSHSIELHPGKIPPPHTHTHTHTHTHGGHTHSHTNMNSPCQSDDLNLNCPIHELFIFIGGKNRSDLSRRNSIQLVCFSLFSLLSNNNNSSNNNNTVFTVAPILTVLTLLWLYGSHFGLKALPALLNCTVSRRCRRPVSRNRDGQPSSRQRGKTLLRGTPRLPNEDKWMASGVQA